MVIHILTIFPEFFTSPLGESILKRAQESQAVRFHIVNIRDFATDKRQTTDDRPFGGGPGMVMKIEPIAKALESLKLPTRKDGLRIESAMTAERHPELDSGSMPQSRIVLTSAKGALFTQQTAQKWAGLTDLVIICGHYEGVDERVAEHLVDEEVRIGDYVLTGGEPAALVIADAVARLLPGVLGNDTSTADESHSTPGVLEYPQYTRPEVFHNWAVPKVLLQGNHKEINAWRAEKQKKA